jgi:hypothetical protein
MEIKTQRKRTKGMIMDKETREALKEIKTTVDRIENKTAENYAAIMVVQNDIGYNKTSIHEAHNKIRALECNQREVVNVAFKKVSLILTVLAIILGFAIKIWG